MAEIGTLDILGEIQALVSDKLQVVSYKWLSRNFSVSSNDAKRILQTYVEQNRNGLEIAYLVSGWLKNTPPVYHIQLVSGAKLAEVRQQFEDDCSVQVYSVQGCIPKDPAALWNYEFVQAEELYCQPSSVDNCLRDNRFCGVSNSFVKRNVNGTSLGVASTHSKSAGITASSKNNNALQTSTVPQQKGKIQQLSPKREHSPAVAAPLVKTESKASESNAQSDTNIEKATAISDNKKKAQNGRNSSGTGGSLANMWGKASVKSKPTSPLETSKVVQIPVGNITTADAQICAREAMDTVVSDDDEDDDQCVNLKRSSNGEGNRKRRFVMDFSDDEDFENAVNLASPDPPKKHPSKDSESSPKMSLAENNDLNFESPNVDQSKIKQEKTDKRDPKPPSKEGEVNKAIGKPVKIPDSEDNAHRNDKAIDGASNSTKRKKVLKTRIDERGREVTEVVWEGEEIENQNTDKKDTVNETAANRPQGAKKSPAFASNAPSNPVGKTGGKKAGKGGAKDAKQGNILSFFKKV